MRNFKLLIISSLYFFATQANAQRNADCIKAKDICKKGTHEITKASGEGKDPMEGFPAPCFAGGDQMNNNPEKNSTWIKVKIAKSGSLKFTIRPKKYDDDLDFVVYRVSGDNCQNKKIVRCMAAGDKAYPSFCLGATGLRDGEGDVSENAGCNGENNSFLQPLSVKGGETYVILVSNVTSAGEGFSIRLFGTCMLPCDEEKKPKPEVKEVPEVKEPEVTTQPIADVPKPIVLETPKQPEVKPIEPTPTPPIAKETEKVQPSIIEGRKTIVNKTLSVKNRRINMKVWDSSIEDGDIISIYINGKKKYADIVLTTKPQEFIIDLDEGENFITAHIESFGKREDNTASISVNDGKKIQKLTLNATRNQEETMKVIVE